MTHIGIQRCPKIPYRITGIPNIINNNNNTQLMTVLLHSFRVKIFVYRP